MRSRRGESVLEKVLILAFCAGFLIGLGYMFAAIFEKHYYHISCISPDGTEKYEAEAFGIDRLRYNVWEFHRSDDPTVVITWRGYCDSYRLN